MKAAKRAESLHALLKQAEFGEMAGEVQAVIRTAVRVQVGVIGDFSSGKSTLLNALVGGHWLPESDQPTTGSITLVESAWEESEPTYLAQTEAGRTPISAQAFADLVLQGGDALPVLVVPARALPAGFRFVDTPGLESLRQLDAQTTLGFAAYLDAVVVCVDVNRGGLSPSLIAFLEQPTVSDLRRDAIVVLCKADQKPASACASVAAAVLQRLRASMSAEDWARIDERHRVVAVSAKQALNGEDAAMEQLRSILTSVVYDRRAQLEDGRRLASLEPLRCRALEAVEDRIQNLSLDDGELRQKERDIEQAIDTVRTQRRRAEARVDELQSRLHTNLKEIARSYRRGLTSPEKDERLAAADELLRQIESTAQQSVRSYVGEVGDLPRIAQVGDLQARIDRIYRSRDAAVTIATGALVAFVSGGTSLVGNAAEATAGGALEAAGTRAARGKLLGRILGEAGHVLRQVNPLQHLGDWAAGRLAESTADAEL